MNLQNFIEQINAGAFDTGLDQITTVKHAIPGFSTVQLVRIISLAVSNLDEGEIYLEVGSHQGLTLIGTMIDNKSKQAVATDNFSQFNDDGLTQTKLLQNINKFNLKENIVFFPWDYKKLLSIENIRPFGKVGVYFYDGNHDSDIGYDGLVRAVPLLADKAVIIMDDFSGPGIWDSMRMFLNQYPKQSTIIFAMRTNDFPNPHAKWWNGIIVLAWRS